MTLKSLTLTLSLFSLSCGTSKSSSSADPILGTWKHSDCQPAILSLMSTYYSKSTVVFTSTEVKYSELLYSDSACLTDMQTIVNAVGTYKKNTSNSKDIDFEWKAISLTPKSAESAKNFSDFSLCGIGSWSVDSAQSVKTKSCQSWGRTFASDEKVLQIYEVEAGKLWFGSTIYLKSETRPTSLPDRAFEKSE